MDDFSATQLCESSKRLSELPQTQNPDGDKKKQIGSLTYNNRDFPIYIGINKIGRFFSNDIIIKHASVSKIHAELEGGVKCCYLTDLKSLNGTYDHFDHKYQENKAYALSNGSIIKFGDVETTFTHFRFYENDFATPVRTKINQMVTSTPKSIVNSTFYDVPQNPRSPKKTNSKRTNAESSIKDSTNASKETVVNPRISRRGKIPTASPSNLLTPNQALNQENLSASSSIPSQAVSDLNSLSASTSSRAKRSKQNSRLKHKVLFTGIPVDIYQKQLTKLGLNQTDDVKKCTILVTDKVRRTFKFLCSISRGIPILSVKWITDSVQKSNIQDFEDYVISDRIAERKFNFNLKESLQKARDRKMLEGYTVILTPNITAPPVAELKEMVMASGGKVLLRPPKTWKKDTIIVSNDQDIKNAKKFMAIAPNTVSLHSTEFLLTGILKQEVDLESYLLKFT